MKLKTRHISLEGEIPFKRKFAIAKEQTKKYCPEELAKELEAEGYMIDKPYPFMDSTQELEAVIRDDENDENAPQEWITKMFPELHV